MTVGDVLEGDNEPPGPVGLTRDDLASGLGELIAALAQAPEPVRLKLVGGAAISLVYDADRRRTVDIDGVLTPRALVLDVAKPIGARRGWSDDWINDAAGHFLPAGYGGREQEWVTVHDDGHVVIEVGSAAMLLAMKLLAAQRRGMREFRDIAVLASAAGVHSVVDAEELFGEFYPGDAFTPRTVKIVGDALDSGYVGRHASLPDLDGSATRAARAG